MKLFHRYIFESILTTALAATAIFVFVLLVGNAMKDLVGLLAQGRVSWLGFLEMLILLTPFAVSYALPLGVLTGILITLGRLSSQREIVALKAAGVSLWSITAPVLAIAILAASFACFINNAYAPGARARYREKLTEMVRESPARFIAPKIFSKEFGRYIIYAGEREGERLEDLWIWELDEFDRPIKLLRARSGLFNFSEASDSLVLTLYEGSSELRDEKDPDNLRQAQPLLEFSETTIRLPMDHLLGESQFKKKLSYMRLGELLERRAEKAAELAALPAEAELQSRESLSKEVMRVQIQLQRNFVWSFAVFSLAVFGVPLGIRVSRKESYANFALAVSLGIAFYFLLNLMMIFENRPELRPDLLIWIPNFVFQGAGVWLLWKANKH